MRTIELKSNEYKDRPILYILTREGKYLYVGLTRNIFSGIGSFYLFQEENLIDVDLTLEIMDDKKSALQRRKDLIARHKPEWNGKRGRPAIDEKAITGTSHRDRVKTDIVIDKALISKKNQNKIIKASQREFDPEEDLLNILKGL